MGNHNIQETGLDMESKRADKTCCVGASGVKLAFHLRCLACRKRAARDERRTLLVNATPPVGCSGEVPIAPARGAVLPYRELRVLPTADGVDAVEAPYRAGCPARPRDVFDTMIDQGTRRGGSVPFTSGQLGAARDYGALFEKVHGSGMKCSKAFEVERAGQGGVDFMDAYRRDTRRLAAFREAIGIDLALEVRAVGAHIMDRGRRVSISDAVLVHTVCISQAPLSMVLKAHGWAASTKNTVALRAKLCAVLDRMQGI